MTPTGRPATCAVTWPPSARAWCTPRISRRQRSGSVGRSVNRNHTGRPVSFDSRVIQANSRASSSKSLFMPKAPAPTAPIARPIPASSASSALCAGTSSPVLGLVRIGARGGEAERAGAQGVGGQPMHRGDVLRGRGLAVDAALAHHIDAQRMMRDLCRDIDRARQAFERVEELRKALPVPGKSFVQGGAGNVLDRLHQVDQLAATGAKPTPQLPKRIVVTPCQDEGARTGSQVAWPS